MSLEWMPSREGSSVELGAYAWWMPGEDWALGTRGKSEADACTVVEVVLHSTSSRFHLDFA
ncbi:MAG TPA: hypothetical protein DFR83_02970 [Deltaproteobacteria bacterium]|nr:hypothetical protein [Deltaproteobacteria bacterium]